MAKETKLKPIDAGKLLVKQESTSMSDIVRANLRSNNTFLLQFISDVGEFQVENHRTVLIKETTIKLIDILCGISNHYPEKPKEPKEPKETKKTKK